MPSNVNYDQAPRVLIRTLLSAAKCVCGHGGFPSSWIWSGQVLCAQAWRPSSHRRVQAYKFSQGPHPRPLRAQSQPLADAASRVYSSLRVWFRRRAVASLLRLPGRKDQMCSRAGLQDIRLDTEGDRGEDGPEGRGAPSRQVTTGHGRPGPQNGL